MPKIQARDIDEALYELIVQSAMKNERSLEGEIRIALREYYQPAGQDTPALSARQRWQHETGTRLGWLFKRLAADQYFPGVRDENEWGHAQLARLLEQPSPGELMDLVAGQQALSFALADRIAATFAASADWLLSGKGTPFPVARIGSSYREFFLPADGRQGYLFELVRIAGGRHEGTLFCVRHHPETLTYALGVVCEQFMLCDGMGSGGHGNLKRFLLFLKTECGSLPLNAFSWTPDAPEDDIWAIFGQHHPRYFQDASRRTTASWLQQLLMGEDPADWFAGYGPALEEIKNTPFGDTTRAE